MTDNKVGNGTRHTLYTKCVLAFAFIYYLLTLVADVFSLFVDLRFMSVVETVFVVAVMVGAVLAVLDNKYWKMVFVLSSAVVVISQLIGSGLVLWPNCAIETVLALLVVFARNKK